MRACEACGGSLEGRRAHARTCSDACRMRAHRARARRVATPARLAPAQTVYECSSCGERHLGERRCPDCNLFMRALGPGGECPHCAEPVAVGDLLV